MSAFFESKVKAPVMKLLQSGGAPHDRSLSHCRSTHCAAADVVLCCALSLCHAQLLLTASRSPWRSACLAVRGVLLSSCVRGCVVLMHRINAIAGIFPIPGVTTVPVMIAIYLFKLNPVAAMLTNYLCTPLNVAAVPLFM